MLNPVTVVANVVRSGAVFVNLIIIGAILSASRGHKVIAGFAAALASSFDPNLAIQLLLCTSVFSFKSGIYRLLSAFALTFLILLGASRLIFGDFEFLYNIVNCHFVFGSLKPNIGLVWYLMAVIFPRFRSFFVAICQALISFTPIPLGYRLRKDPVILTGIILFLRCILSPYPTLPDLVLAVIYVLFTSRNPFKRKFSIFPK